MPFETQCTANTPETVHECVCIIYNMSQAHRRDHRVSVVLDSGRSQVEIGDDLDLVNPDNQKLLKKRWWEPRRYDENQLRLPFLAYLPAEIGALRWLSARRVFSMKLIFMDVAGESCDITVKSPTDDGLRADDTSIVAIRLHHCIRERPTRSFDYREYFRDRSREWDTTAIRTLPAVPREAVLREEAVRRAESPMMVQQIDLALQDYTVATRDHMLNV